MQGIALENAVCACMQRPGWYCSLRRPPGSATAFLSVASEREGGKTSGQTKQARTSESAETDGEITEDGEIILQLCFMYRVCAQCRIMPSISVSQGCVLPL